jgi:solute carrier family 12 sodium/potassium/chloride transporter 2
VGWLSEHLDRILFHLNETPITVLTLLLVLGVAVLSAYAGPLIRHLLARIAAPATPKPGVVSKKFGTFEGVFTPSILTILGVIMYLRLGWVVGNKGLGGALLIVTVSHVITFLTGLSVSSIATNRRVGAGGAYFIISRSLGAPAGAAIGIPLFFGQALSVTFYIVGFTESLRELWPGVPELFISSAVCGGLALLSIKGAGIALKAQFFVMAAIGISLVSFFAGGKDPAPGVQWWNPEGQSFAAVFSVFFPAVTGIMAGVGMSGDLADPRRSLPRGTMLSIVCGFVVYMTFPIFLSHNASSAALIENKRIVWDLSAMPSLIYLGVWGATLSSALGSMLTAPRTLQALAADGLAPRVLAKGSGPLNEPRIGTVLTFALAQTGILLGNLDVIAPILTMFFLATYGFTNLACGLEQWAASPSFRPDFRVPAGVALLGAIACFYVMSVIDVVAMLGALVVCGLIYVFVQQRVLGTTYGDARHGIWSAIVRSALYHLRRTEFHPLNWRPNLIVMGGDHEKRPYLLELGSTIVQDRGLVTYFQLVKGTVENHADRRKQIARLLEDQVDDRYANVFCRVDIVDDVYRGMVTVAQSYGVGSFEANTVMLGWPRKRDHEQAYCATMRDLVKLDRSLLIVSYNRQRKFGNRTEIHIWWGGLQGNGGLMLLLAFLMTAHHQWRNAKVTLMTILRDEEERRSAEQNIARVLASARVDATPRLILKDERAIPDIIHAESRDADLAILGLALPGIEEHEVKAFFTRTNQLLDDMPTSILVHSARHFRGEPVLFDAAPPADDDEEDDTNS